MRSFSREGRFSPGVDGRTRRRVHRHVLERRSRILPPRIRRCRAEDAVRRAGGRRRCTRAARQATSARGSSATPGIPPRPAGRRRGRARRGPARVHRQDPTRPRRRRRSLPRGRARGPRLRPDRRRGRHDRSSRTIRQRRHRVLPGVQFSRRRSARQRRGLVGQAAQALQPRVPQSRGGDIRQRHGKRRP